MSSPAVAILGPIQSRVVLLDGYRVPYLAADPVNGGQVRLTLDERFSFDVAVSDLDRTVEFIAHCIAVAAGFTCHPGAVEPTRRTVYSRWVGVSSGTEQQT